MSFGKIIYYNKYLLDYIFSFDDTNIKNYKTKLVFSKAIQEASNIYWYNKYEKELLYGSCSLMLVLEYQDAYLDTLYLITPELFY
jgi:hypothetical protein